MVEHFANSAAPSAPLAGQLWWDTSNNLMKVYTGTTFKTISSSTSQSTEPSSTVIGDLWWDTSNNQLKVYNGSGFTLIGPAFTAGSGQSGPIVDTITDSVGTEHVVVKIFASDTIVGIVSKDASFTPQTAIAGFSTVNPGYNLNSTISNILFNGTASDSQKLDGVAATSYLRSDTNDSTSGTLAINNDTGLTVGGDADLKISVSAGAVQIQNQTTDEDIVFSVTDGGALTEAMRIDGATHKVTITEDPTSSDGVATKNYVDTQISGSGALLVSGGTMTGNILSDDGTQEIGSSGTPFNAVYADTFEGISTSARYADLAEIYASDVDYEPGTVVKLGGSHEITATTENLDNDVFGVVSEKPAYLMNSEAEGLPVALTGRVKIKVEGSVTKGQRLVASATPGVARGADNSEVTFLNVIGRALESGSDVVECVVGKN